MYLSYHTSCPVDNTPCFPGLDPRSPPVLPCARGQSSVYPMRVPHFVVAPVRVASVSTAVPEGPCRCSRSAVRPRDGRVRAPADLSSSLVPDRSGSSAASRSLPGSPVASPFFPRFPSAVRDSGDLPLVPPVRSPACRSSGRLCPVPAVRSSGLPRVLFRVAHATCSGLVPVRPGPSSPDLVCGYLFGSSLGGPARTLPHFRPHLHPGPVPQRWLSSGHLSTLRRCPRHHSPPRCPEIPYPGGGGPRASRGSGPHPDDQRRLHPVPSHIEAARHADLQLEAAWSAGPRGDRHQHRPAPTPLRDGRHYRLHLAPFPFLGRYPFSLCPPDRPC